MKTQKEISMIGLLVLCTLGGIVCPVGRARADELRGSFVRRTELRVGEDVYTGIIVKPLERGEPQTIVIPRQPVRLSTLARRLRAGQRVEITYAEEAGHKWVKRLETEAQHNPGRRPAEVQRTAERRPEEGQRTTGRRPEETQRQRSPAALGARIQRMERQIEALRTEVARLKAQVQERPGPGREVQRNARREGEASKARPARERARSEHAVALKQLEVMRSALQVLREAERGDAAERLSLAIRAREMTLEGRRDEEAQQVRKRAPNRAQLAELLQMAAQLWREHGDAAKAVAVAKLAGQMTPRERPGTRQRPARAAPERAPEAGRDRVARRGPERRTPPSEKQIAILTQAAGILRDMGRAEQAQALNRLVRDMKRRETSRER